MLQNRLPWSELHFIFLISSLSAQSHYHLVAAQCTEPHSCPILCTKPGRFIRQLKWHSHEPCKFQSLDDLHLPSRKSTPASDLKGFCEKSFQKDKTDSFWTPGKPEFQSHAVQGSGAQANALTWKEKEKDSKMSEVVSRIWGIIRKGYVHSHNFTKVFKPVRPSKNRLWDF